jgi:hypothetical protein
MTKKSYYLAPFSSRRLDLSQLLRNIDLKTQEPLCQQKMLLLLACFPIGKILQFSQKGLQCVLSICRKCVCKREAINNARLIEILVSLSFEQDCQHSLGSLKQEEKTHRDRGKIHLVSDIFLKLFKYETKSYQATSFQLL